MPKVIKPNPIGTMYPKTTKAEKQKPITPRSLLSRIPIAGIDNLLESRTKKEGRFWIGVLVIASAITMYYLIPRIREYLKFTKVVEVTHVTEDEPGFPPVQISVSNGLNKTYFVDEFLTKLTPILEKDPRMNALAKRWNASVWLLIAYSIMYMTHTPSHENGWEETLLMHVNEVIYRGQLAFGDDWQGISTVYNESRLHCGQVIQKCTYQGHEFPCCPAYNHTGWGSVTSTVYKIDVPSSSNASSSSPLVIQTAINVTHLFPHMMAEMGVWVHFGHHLGTGFDTIIPISPGSNTLIRIKRKRRQLLGDCTEAYRFKYAKHQRSHPMIQKYYQDMEKPDGYHINKCMTAVLLEEIYHGCGFVADYDTMAPNDTEVCTPAHVNVCILRAYHGDIDLPDVEKKMRDVFKHLKQQISECQELCDRWEY